MKIGFKGGGEELGGAGRGEIIIRICSIKNMYIKRKKSAKCRVGEKMTFCDLMCIFFLFVIILFILYCSVILSVLTLIMEAIIVLNSQKSTAFVCQLLELMGICHYIWLDS